MANEIQTQTTPSSTEIEESPLAEADPKSLDELFALDPLKLSDQQIDTIVASFRAQRKNFAVEEAEAKKDGRNVRKKAIQKVDLDELDLDVL